MFGRKIKLFRLFGFEVGIDWSWFLIALLITWSLAVGLFPSLYPDLAGGTYWWMGVVGALGLFLSVVIHELSHSLVARTQGMEMRGITLFIFGGVAEMSEEPTSPRGEFLMAVVGPFTSLALGGIFWGILQGARAADWSISVQGILSYLALINVVLAGFNILPAFPLDGGRVLRSAVWKATGSLRRATRITSWTGSGLAFLLIAVGLMSLFAGAWLAGIWWGLLGLFLHGAAQASYRQLLVRQVLEGEPVHRVMNDQPLTVPASASVDDVVENYVYRYHHKMFPVVENGGTLAGCVTTRHIRDLPREEWPQRKIGELADQCSEQNVIDANADAIRALTKMNRYGISRMMVVEDGQLRGVVSLKDLSRLIALKLDLQEEEA